MSYGCLPVTRWNPFIGISLHDAMVLNPVTGYLPVDYWPYYQFGLVSGTHLFSYWTEKKDREILLDGVHFIGRTSDAFPVVPHIDMVQGWNPLVIFNTLFGSSISVWGTSGVTIATKNPIFGATDCDLACTPFANIFYSLHLSCFSPISLPVDLTIVWGTAKAGFTWADFLACLVDVAIEIATDIVMKFGGAFLKKAFKGVKGAFKGAGKGIKKLASAAAKKAVKEAVSEAAEVAVKKVAKEAVEEAVAKVGKEVAEEAIAKGSKEVAEEAAEKVSKEVATEAAEKAGKEIVEEVAEKAGKEIADEAAEHAGKEASSAAAEKVAKDASEEAAEEAGDQALKKTSSEVFSEGLEALQKESDEALEEVLNEAADEAASKSGKSAAESFAETLDTFRKEADSELDEIIEEMNQPSKYGSVAVGEAAEETDSLATKAWTKTKSAASSVWKGVKSVPSLIKELKTWKKVTETNMLARGDLLGALGYIGLAKGFKYSKKIYKNVTLIANSGSVGDQDADSSSYNLFLWNLGARDGVLEDVGGETPEVTASGTSTSDRFEWSADLGSGTGAEDATRFAWMSEYALSETVTTTITTDDDRFSWVDETEAEGSNAA